MVQAELAFELLVVELDLPAQPREEGETLGFGIFGEAGDPVIKAGAVTRAPPITALRASW